MRYTTVVAAALVVAASALVAAASSGREAKPRLAFGQLRVGMTYDEVRAATPAVTWTPVTYGARWNPAYLPRFPYDYEMKSLTAKKAIAAGGETFDVEYEDAAWDRYRLSATMRDAAPTNTEPCAQRIFRVMEAIESLNGPLASPELDKTGKTQQLRMAVGKKSFALMTMIPVQGFTLKSERKESDASIEVSGGSSSPSGAGNQECWIGATFKLWPARPPQGFVQAASLQVTHDIGIGAKHHSLDATPPPQGAVDVPLACTIQNNGTLSCDEAPEIAPGAKPFAAAAMFRLRDMRVARRTREGRWTPGELTTLALRIAPDDRQTVGAVDKTKSALLVVTDRYLFSTRFPQRAMEGGVSATLTAGCIVQTDGSPICPELKVEPSTEFDGNFIAASLPGMLFTRHATKLTNGESAVGVGFQLEYTFKVE